jgi:hypothetical protein
MHHIVTIALCIAIPAILSGCRSKPDTAKPDEGVACTQDAKVCPDGSAVGRQGPACEFAPCPGEDADAKPATDAPAEGSGDGAEEASGG